MSGLGIEHSKKVLQDLGKLAIDVIALAKHGIGFGAYRQILKAL